MFFFDVAGKFLGNIEGSLILVSFAVLNKLFLICVLECLEGKYSTNTAVAYRFSHQILSQPFFSCWCSIHPTATGKTEIMNIEKQREFLS